MEEPSRNAVLESTFSDAAQETRRWFLASMAVFNTQAFWWIGLILGSLSVVLAWFVIDDVPAFRLLVGTHFFLFAWMGGGIAGAILWHARRVAPRSPLMPDEVIAFDSTVCLIHFGRRNAGGFGSMRVSNQRLILDAGIFSFGRVQPHSISLDSITFIRRQDLNGLSRLMMDTDQHVMTVSWPKPSTAKAAQSALWTACSPSEGPDRL